MDSENPKKGGKLRARKRGLSAGLHRPSRSFATFLSLRVIVAKVPTAKPYNTRL